MTEKEKIEELSRLIVETREICFKALGIDTKPCNHEPELFHFVVGWQHRRDASEPWKDGGSSEPQPLLKDKCKHCGVKIKAEKWVEE